MTDAKQVPGLLAAMPFAVMLLAIAVLPLLPKTAHHWESNRNKLAFALALSFFCILYYLFRGYGFVHAGHAALPGLHSAAAMLAAALQEYVPFITLLFALFVVSGGLRVTGDLRATPLANAALMAVGAVLASLIGTTGASMVIIRPLLQFNSERAKKVHTIVFFIFTVSNAGGALTPIGDPPLFLGYLMRVPFLWTLQNLWTGWLFMVAALLAIYIIWDSIVVRSEPPEALKLDIERLEPLRVQGLINVIWLAGVVAGTALLDPNMTVPGTSWHPPVFFRELVLLSFAGLSLLTTPGGIRAANRFAYGPIAEVACLFIGIFITMQAPIEILSAQGPHLGLTEPWQFFWATGVLSSFLDNAPTYAVFFQLAGSLPGGVDLLTNVQTATGAISAPLLAAVSYGSVFMGASSYIGNGPNFMVRSIAEADGVKMPSFFGYMLFYSIPVLIPLFLLFTVVFF